MLPTRLIAEILKSHLIARPADSTFRGEVTADLEVDMEVAATRAACRAMAKTATKRGLAEIRVPIRLELSSVRLTRRGARIADLSAALSGTVGMSNR